MTGKQEGYNTNSTFAAAYLRDYAYDNGGSIYQFMKKYGIGESSHGRIMDAMAEGKGVIAHRLYGHHFFSDIPFRDPSKIPAFFEHELSDLLTKQGLPILPGELLEDLGLIKYADKLTDNWYFVNGFDILTATVSIYSGLKRFNLADNYENFIDDLDEFAIGIGVGAIQVAIAISHCNPFLMVGALLHLTSTVRLALNDGAVAVLSRLQDGLCISVGMNRKHIAEMQNSLSIQGQQEMLSIDDWIARNKL